MPQGTQGCLGQRAHAESSPWPARRPNQCSGGRSRPGPQEKVPSSRELDADDGVSRCLPGEREGAIAMMGKARKGKGREGVGAASCWVPPWYRAWRPERDAGCAACAQCPALCSGRTARLSLRPDRDYDCRVCLLVPARPQWRNGCDLAAPSPPFLPSFPLSSLALHRRT